MGQKFLSLFLCLGMGLVVAGYAQESESKALPGQPDVHSDWELSKDANGIKIFTRDYPGSAVKEFLAITTCDCSLKDVVVIINDIERYPEWLRSCKSVEPVRNTEGKTTINHVEISFPWPLSNRDGIWESKTITDTGEMYYAEIRSRPEMLAEIEGIVRMHNASGSWKIERLHNGKVQITQQFFADPEGNIPGWVVNLFLVDGPYDTFMNLLSLLGEPR